MIHQRKAAAAEKKVPMTPDDDDDDDDDDNNADNYNHDHQDSLPSAAPKNLPRKEALQLRSVAPQSFWSPWSSSLSSSSSTSSLPSCDYCCPSNSRSGACVGFCIRSFKARRVR